MKNNILRKNIFILLIGIIVLSVISLIYLYSKNNEKGEGFISFKSEADLKNTLYGKDYNELLKIILTMPYSTLRYGYGLDTGSENLSAPVSSTSSIDRNESSSSNSVGSQSSSSLDYSTTNIQVENVDEADVVKTDGEYIYSISSSSIIISKTDKEGNIEIASKINTTDIPKEFLIKDNKLIIMTDSYGSIYDKPSTTIEIYDISNKLKVKSIKKIKIEQGYYTSRMIDNKVYVLTTGYIRDSYSNGRIPSYSIDNVGNEIPYYKVKYMKNNKDTNYVSIITTVDINDLTKEPEINGYLMPIKNVYISGNNIYTSFEKSEKFNKENNFNKIKSLVSLGGIPGFINYMVNYYEGNYEDKKYTNIVKFGFTSTGIEYLANVKEEGKILNQFSMDEYMGSLRVTLSEGTKKSKLVVFSNEMKKIGIVDNIAPGEKIYATRFIKDRAYVVTYDTIDPLFVIDLKEPTNPKILGELKIPGYSTYLHPYDENHIIGIGNATEEKITKDANGKISSKRAVITGMKMAIFDVTDVKNPKEQFSQKIGDRTTYSTILKNHKALLFSKEKELLAIPINNYKEDVEVDSSSNNNIKSAINITEKLINKVIKSGYIVYNINLTDGFKEKGVITHDTLNKKGEYWYTENNQVRGVYIGDNLYTVSEGYIKSNSLDKLEEKSSIQLGR